MPTFEELQKAFAAFDADGSGSLSPDELINILTRPTGGLPMSRAEAEQLIKTVDANNDGVLQMEEFCELMTTPGSLTMLPAPPDTQYARLKDFETETSVIKPTSPLRIYFARVGARDPSLTTVKLVTEADGSLGTEFRTWTSTRKAAALALMTDSPVLTVIDLNNLNLTDRCTRSLAAVLSAPSCAVEVLNLERNNLAEPGVLAILAALKGNSTVRELRLTSATGGALSTAVEVALADLLDDGNETLVKIGPPMRNPNERRRVEAKLAKNMDIQRQKRNAAKAAAAK